MTEPALHPSELQFLLPESKTNTGALFGGATLSWSMIVLMLALLVWVRPGGAVRDVLPRLEPVDLVYLQELGPGGGGGGGGNRSVDPPRTSPVPKVTPIEPDPVPVATVNPIPDPEPVIAAQVQAITESSTIALVGPTSNTDSLSRGPGSGPGTGTGDGPGNGPGKGPGLGPGEDGNTGGKAFRPGPGLINPVLISSAKPSYTPEAMFRRIQGVAVLECVVERNGTVDNCTVVRSLDSTFGLDEEAIKAARQFRFTPGRRQGEPVPVLVRIEIEFRIR